MATDAERVKDLDFAKARRAGKDAARKRAAMRLMDDGWTAEEASRSSEVKADAVTVRRWRKEHENAKR